MSQLLVALENSELKIASRMKEYGQHDDLVIALALAVWRARRFYRGGAGPGSIVWRR